MMRAQPSIPTRRERLLLLGLILLGVVLISFFGLRAVRSYALFRQTRLEPGITDVEAIRPWMTIPYIARAYQVPETYIFDQIGLPETDNQRKSLGRLNREYAPNKHDAILNAVKAAIKRYQAEHPPPTGGQP